MSTEKIAVVYEPLGTIAGITYYHETLVYTNYAGQQSIASAFSTVSPTGSALSNVIQASGAVSAGTASNYGTLGTVTGSVNDSTVKSTVNVANLISSSNPSETVATGTDLSAKWNAIVSTEHSISSENLGYSPVTQNSNSVVTTALQAAGILAPSDNGLFSSHWAPAAGNVLPAPAVTQTDNQTTISQDESQLNNAEADGNLTYSGESFTPSWIPPPPPTKGFVDGPAVCGTIMESNSTSHEAYDHNVILVGVLAPIELGAFGN